MIKEKIKPEDFQDTVNRKIIEEIYKEFEKQNFNSNSIIDLFDDEIQSHITMIMAYDYEITDKNKAIEDIILNYEKEKLNERKMQILEMLDKENNEEQKKELEKELNNVIISLAKIK